MARDRKPSSILDSLGEEIVRIVIPVSICMFLVVILVCILNSDSSSSSVNSIATMAYTETNSDSIWEKLEGALLNSLVFVALITAATFLLVLLFYHRCTKFLKLYMGFSAFVVLGFMGGQLALFLIEEFNVRIDCISFLVTLFNFAVVGVSAVFMSKMAILITQAYLVLIGMLVAYWFTLLPEWTTWVLLVAMSLYDLAAVLLPVGPLKILVELAISRDEDIPALVYEARPVTQSSEDNVVQRRVWRERMANSHSSESSDQNVETQANHYPNTELSTPLIDSRMTTLTTQQDDVSSENILLEDIRLGSTGAIKLGLGDFIFYSVLVGRAAMYDVMTVYACYLAVIAGLGITLILLAFYQKALPALPVSVLLGVLFYFLTRFLLEVFVVQCSLNLVMF